MVMVAQFFIRELIKNIIIWTGENFLSQNGNTCEKSSASNYFEGFSKDYEINNGELYFTINEFEAFQIIMS